MQLVEQHVISKSDPRYAVIDAAAFASKNLYNAANYEIRQAFIRRGVVLLIGWSGSLPYALAASPITCIPPVDA